MDIQQVKRSFEIELLLLGNGASLFVNNYLKHFYDDINTKSEKDQLKLIIAPVDVAINRLSQATNKTVEQLFNLEVGIDIFANYISTEEPDPTSTISYIAFNGRVVSNDSVNKLRILYKDVTTNELGQSLYVLIVDSIMFFDNQLNDLKNYVIPEVIQIPVTTVPDVKTAYYLSLPNEILRKIAVSLSLEDIYSLCVTSRRFNLAICDDDRFWNEKIRKDFPNKNIKTKETFKKTYRSLLTELYGFGGNASGELGLAGTQNRNTLTRNPYINDVDFVACGTQHSAVISNGELYTFGNNVYGQLGLGYTRNESIPTRVPNINNVTYVSCGNQHTAFVAGGKLYTVGRGNFGQLGFELIYDTVSPLPIESLDNVSMVACGSEHTAVISNNKLYTFGSGIFGQLGLGDMRNRLTPTLVSETNNVTFVACGSKHTAIISNGQLYTFGFGRMGNLGLGDFTTRHIPTLVPDLNNVSYIACGGDHSAAISNGQLYTFGDNSGGALGLGDYRNRLVPTLVPNINNVSFVACGEGRIAVIADSKLYTAGGNIEGILDVDFSHLTLVNNFVDAIFVACGSGYTLVIALKQKQ